MPAPKTPKNDDSILDITGLFELLATGTGSAPASSAGEITQVGQNYYHYEAPSLGKIYGQKLGLTTRQTGWLNKFYLPTNGFLDIEAARQATVLLYATALLAVDRQLKTEGSTLAREVEILDHAARQLRYSSHSWYYGSTKGDKPGADVYLAAFRQCENAVRVHFDYGRKDSALFVRQIAGLGPEYQQQLGRRVLALLPALVAQVPRPSPATERLLNAESPARWKTRFAQLLPLLPAKVPRFVAAVEKLGTLNELNPNATALYFEAAKLLVKLDREATLRLYLRHLAHEYQYDERRVKLLPKTAQKALFPLPEHAERFEQITLSLEASQDLKYALSRLPSVYAVQRKTIELDHHAIHAVRGQHANTVELLNEYLRDEPDTPALPPSPATATAAKKPKAPKTAPAKPAPKVPKTAAPRGAKASAVARPAVPNPFASNLGLTAVQRELLLLFAAQRLALPRTTVEAFAQRHGALRNQLIDGLNEACYALLDDVLIEESGEDYTIYAPYYEKLS